MAKTATENGPSPKRIILCLDGTFDDTADTVERVYPGSSVSRFFRWILPPLVFMIIWGSGIFPLWKKLEKKLEKILGQPDKKPFHTNVSLLASAIKSHGCWDGHSAQKPQLIMYIGGIGAIGNPQSRFEEAVTGNTMTYKVRHAYRLIVDNYCADDEIFLFGFSRGAFTARAIAGFINWAGLLKKDKATYFDEVWEAYRSRNGQEGAEGLEFEHTATIMLGDGLTFGDIRHGSNRLRCIGVWDTVGSLGTPPIWAPSKSNDVAVARAARKRYKFFDPELKDNVDHAFQALALDEQRFDFYPAVWNKPNHMDCRSFAQVWFPGVHTDVGGGKAGSGSRYAFIWMVSKIQECGLLDLDTSLIQSISKSLTYDEIPKATPPWKLKIRHCHWLYPLIGRHGYRNPNMPVAYLSPQGHGNADESENLLLVEQKFHWTVIERINRPRSTYWTDCKALRRANPVRNSVMISPENICTRQEDPVGEDRILRKYWENIEDVEGDGGWTSLLARY